MSELLLSGKELTKAFGAEPLFEGLSFGIFEGDHIGLVGPNGSGKSTLLRILAGLEPPSSGVLAPRKRLRIAYVPQDPDFAPDATVGSVLLEAGPGSRPRRARGGGAGGCGHGQGGLFGWSVAHAVALGRLEEAAGHRPRAGPGARAAAARRAHEPPGRRGHPLARGPAAPRARGVPGGEPRPLLPGVRGRTHDRAEPGVRRRASWRCAGATATSCGRRTSSWRGRLRTRSRSATGCAGSSNGCRARRRRARARPRRASTRRGGSRTSSPTSTSARRSSSVGIDFSGTARQTRRLLVATDLTKALGGRTLVRGLDLVLSPGLRLGLLGANGSGKTTLLRLLAGLDSPDAGTIERAPNLKIVTFDQHRAHLDPAVSLKRTLSPFGDSVVFQGRQVHVAGWAKRFLFRSEQLETPVGRLSGWRAGPGPDRAARARARRRPSPRRAHERPGHSHPGGAGGKPAGVPGSARPRDPRPLPARSRVHPPARPRRRGRGPLLRRLRAVGAGPRGGGRGGGSRERVRSTEDGPRASRRAQPEAPSPRATSSNASGSGWRRASWTRSASLAACQEAAADPAVAADHKALAERLAALAAAQARVEELYGRWAELEAKVKA